MSKITKKGLLENGFVEITYQGVSCNIYKKDDIVIMKSIAPWLDEKSFMWDLRRKIDNNNSIFVANIENFEDINKYFNE